MYRCRQVNESVHQTFFKDAEFALGHARADGILPQFCPPTGPCGYGQNCNDTVGAPDWQGCQDLDSCAFGVKWAAHIWSHVPPAQASAFFKRWLPTLLRGMAATTKSPSGSGLLWSNTSRPMVGYGFQDGEWKSGDVLYSNVLYWNATRLVGEMASKQGDTATAAKMARQADAVRAAVTKELWNASAGMFMASNGLSSGNIDIWVL